MRMSVLCLPLTIAHLLSCLACITPAHARTYATSPIIPCQSLTGPHKHKRLRRLAKKKKVGYSDCFKNVADHRGLTYSLCSQSYKFIIDDPR